MLLAWVLSLLPLTLADPCYRGAIYNDQRDVCYNFISDPLPFLDAEMNCLGMNGSLVSIYSAFENTLISDVASYPFAGKADFWIGASFYSLFDKWMWLDMLPLTYRKWATGEPSVNECVSVQVNNGRWETAPCNASKPYVCMTSAAPKNKCDNNWMYFETTNSCYYPMSDTSSFTGAEASCVSIGGHLASIHRWMEYAFVIERSHKWNTWASIYYNGSSWVNTDGSPVDTNFISTDGNGTCMAFDLQLTSNIWFKPRPCDQLNAYVCKKAAY